jgi:hypothetical protein
VTASWSARLDAVLDLAHNPQRLAARDQQRQLLELAHELRQIGSRLDELLHIVEDQQQPLSLQVPEQFSPRGERRCDRRQDERRISERLERHPPHPVPEVLDCVGRELERQACLPRTARADEGHDAALPHELARLAKLPLAPDERRRLDGQVRLVKRLEWGELLVTELVQAHGCTQVLEPMVAQVAELEGFVQDLAGGP